MAILELETVGTINQGLKEDAKWPTHELTAAEKAKNVRMSIAQPGKFASLMPRQVTSFQTALNKISPGLKWEEEDEEEAWRNKATEQQRRFRTVGRHCLCIGLQQSLQQFIW